MDFVLNSKKKIVEISYNSAEEQTAILQFIQDHISYRADKTDWNPNYNPLTGITWATNSTISNSKSTADTDIATITLQDYTSDLRSAIATNAAKVDTVDFGEPKITC